MRRMLTPCALAAAALITAGCSNPAASPGPAGEGTTATVETATATATSAAPVTTSASAVPLTTSVPAASTASAPVASGNPSAAASTPAASAPTVSAASGNPSAAPSTFDLPAARADHTSDLRNWSCTANADESWSFRGTVRNATDHAMRYTVALAITSGPVVRGHGVVSVTVPANAERPVSAPRFANAPAAAGTSCEPVVSAEAAA